MSDLVLKYTTRYYRVAGHLFCISLPEGTGLWKRLGQYGPFEVPAAAASESAAASEPAVSEPAKPSEDAHLLFNFMLVDELPDVEKIVVLAPEPEEGSIQIVLYRAGSDWLFELKDPAGASAEMLASDDFSQARFLPHTDRPAELVGLTNSALMLLFAFASCPHNTLEIHASVVSNSGRAYLFLGKSGTGKSTHSRLWLENIPGSELMNDDNPIVRVLADGTVMVYGSPWSGKTPCYRNVAAQAGAFVKIVQDKDNRIEEMGILEAYVALYSSSSGFKSETRFADGMHPTLEKTVTTVPFYQLYCRPDSEAAEICHKAVCW